MNEETAAQLKRLDDALLRYVRPDTFRLATRMLKPGEALPEDVRISQAEPQGAMDRLPIHERCEPPQSNVRLVY